MSAFKSFIQKLEVAGKKVKVVIAGTEVSGVVEDVLDDLVRFKAESGKTYLLNVDAIIVVE